MLTNIDFFILSQQSRNDSAFFQMIHVVIGLISFAAIFSGALIGCFVRRRLPSRHLSTETQSVVTVSVAVIGTLSALVLA